MAWPLSQDYNEAIQSPHTSFSDPELQAGQPTTNALGIPQPRSGNFADVYEFDCPQTKTRWAVKCFTREVRGLHERYAEISRCLQEVRLPFGVDFQYLEKGVRIRGAWYPALKMRWVEGLLLNEFVRDNLDKPARLQGLCQIWTRMATRLREAKLAHADLQHGNVILVPGSKDNSLAIKLIDYDGMFVPALAGMESGEVGHPNYQHPQRLRDGTYSSEVDRFPLLVVGTALRALTIGGQKLWDRYDNGDNLLFKESDLRSPAQSPLFKELREIDDPETRRLVTQVMQAVERPLEECPLLKEAPAKAAVPPVPKGSPRTASSTAITSVANAANSNFDFEEKESKRRGQPRPSKSPAPLIAAAAGGGVVFVSLAVGVLVWAMRPAPEKAQPTAGITQVASGGGKKKGVEKPVTPAPKGELPKIPPKNDPPPPPAVVEDPKPKPEIEGGEVSKPEGADLAGWGLAIDPDKDCKIQAKEDKLTLEVPGTRHDLSPDSGKMNAPRVMCEVEGDFSIRVKVVGEFRPGGKSTNPRGVPFNGAGILVWSDSDNFIRLERAAVLRGEKVNPYILFEKRLGGAGGGAPTPVYKGGDCYLRMERKGGRISSAVSFDNVNWMPLSPIDVDWPAKVQIGLAAVNSNNQPFIVTFEGFKREGKTK